MAVEKRKPGKPYSTFYRVLGYLEARMDQCVPVEELAQEAYGTATRRDIQSIHGVISRIRKSHDQYTIDTYNQTYLLRESSDDERIARIQKSRTLYHNHGRPPRVRDRVVKFLEDRAGTWVQTRTICLMLYRIDDELAMKAAYIMLNRVGKVCSGRLEHRRGGRGVPAAYRLKPQ